MMIITYYLSFFSFYYYYFIFLLYNTVLVLPYINMNPPRVYISSHSWTPLPRASPYHPSGLSQCTSPKHPVSCIELRLAICFLYDIILCFNAILPNHPAFSLSHRVKKSVLYICVSFAVSRTELSLPCTLWHPLLGICNQILLWSKGNNRLERHQS